MRANEWLQAFPILQGLPDEALARLSMVRVERQQGKLFFSQGDPGDAVYGVLSGRVRITKHALSGREFNLDIFGPGDLIAAVAVFRDIPMPASAIALEPTTCARIDGPLFRNVLEAHPLVVTRMLDLMTCRLVDAGTARLTLATEPVEVRLAHTVLRMVGRFGVREGDQILLTRDFTRQQLADLAGTTVESTIRVLSRWVRDGILARETPRLRILQPGALERLVGGSD